MTKRTQTTLAAAAAVLFLTACEAQKSSNPLSPSVAGPIPGVDITAPKVLEPAAGTKIPVDSQPVTLLIENPSSTGPRPLTLLVEIATDAAFSNKVFSQEGLAPGNAGRTSVRLPDPLASGHTYFWRARAQDGANTGPYSGAADFNVFTPIVIEAPIPISPAANSTVDSVRPKFVVVNAPRSGPVGPISYLIELADSDAFTNKASLTLAEQPTQTTFETPVDLAYNKVYYWHVRAFDSTTTGPFSRNLAFATPAPPVVVTPPTPGGGGGGAAAGDAFNLAAAIIVKGPAISTWAATSTVTEAHVGDGQLCIYHTQLGRWPTAPFFGDPGVPIEGNQWLFIQRNGQWYGGANDWYRPGQACKGIDSNIGHDGFSEEPLHSWNPQPGEVFAVLSSTPARLWPDMSTVDQRTNVVTIRWQ